MKNLYNDIIGSKVISIEIAGKEMHIKFDSGWWVSIFNDRHWEPRSRSVGNIDLDQLKLEKVDIQNTDSIVFVFRGDRSLVVDLSESGYRGPEAMNIFSPDGETYVVQ